MPPKPAEKSICIIAALVNPKGADKGSESVTLLNTTPQDIDLTGWSLIDKNKKKLVLKEGIAAGEARRVHLSGQDIELSNNGGIITLLNKSGIKIDGVSYTKKDASIDGRTIVF